MEESKIVNISLDKNSIEILRQVDNIHKSSLINLAISLISKTGYYRTLTGKVADELEDVTSLEAMNIAPKNTTEKTKNKVEEPKAKASSSWDDF
jgi:hypothetical protein